MHLKDEENPILILKAAFKSPNSWIGVATIIIGIIIATVVSKRAAAMRTQNIIALAGSLVSILGTQSILQEIAKVEVNNDPKLKDSPFNTTNNKNNFTPF